MPPLTLQEEGLTKGTSCPSQCQVPLEPLPHVLGKALSRPPGPGVPGGRVSPHVSMGRATCPLLWAAALGGCPAVEYLSLQGVLLPLVYGTTASPLWPSRGHSAWQVTPSWTVYRLACHRWLRVTSMVSLAGLGPSTAPATGPLGRLGRPSASDPWGIGSFLSLCAPWPLGSCSPVCCCVASAVSWASWLLFTGVLARPVVLHVWCPGPLGSCSPVCVLRCACAMGGCVPLPPPLIFVFFWEKKRTKKRKTGAHVHSFLSIVD